MWNNENSKNYPFIKNRYYPGKLLHAGDFVKEQEYGNRKLEFINRKFHGCGIIEGLWVHPAKTGALKIKAGSALDRQGRIILLPQDTEVDTGAIEGLTENGEQDFVLGIRYAEKTAEKERSFLGKEETYQAARVEETYGLKAYPWSEWQRLNAGVGKRAAGLTEERVLYENGEVRLTMKVPKVVPADSIFRIRIQVQALNGKHVNIGWRGMAKLRGAYFSATGQPFQILEGKETLLAGNLCRDWEICTEEGRRLPLTLELSHLDIMPEDSGQTRSETFQFYIEAAVNYDAAVRKHLWEETENDRLPIAEETDGNQPEGEDWLPLAHLRMQKSESDAKPVFLLQKDSNVRFFALHPGEQELLRRVSEENGIVDIRWRGLLKSRTPGSLQPEYPQPYPPEPMPTKPVIPLPPPPETGLTQERVRELIEEDREKRVRRGIAVISIPRHYRSGQVLLSEEISHGFPGEEVFLWCGRVHEEHQYAYWDRSRMKYHVVSGPEKLFREKRQRGWGIEQQALRQNVEAGTFRIALTLYKGGRRDRSEEVAISWIAVRTI